jgi:K+-transporting ATPase A subunit
MAWSLLLDPLFGANKPLKVKLTKEISPMLWTILVILLVLWLIGFLGNVGGGLIHLLLVIALIVFIINLVSGRRAV